MNCHRVSCILSCLCTYSQECTDSCCNPATCQLKDGAQCSAGPCCTATCQFVAYGTTCRASSGECDIVEYCPGDSSECPEDNFKQDGISCGGNTGYCYQGSCPTHDQQCKYYFGQGKHQSYCLKAKMAHYTPYSAFMSPENVHKLMGRVYRVKWYS